MNIPDHDPSVGRAHPSEAFPHILGITDVFLKGIEADKDLYRDAYDLVVTGYVADALPADLPGPAIVLPVWNGQHQPLSIIPALVTIIGRTGCKDVIYSGGRTNADWPETQNEAEMLHAFVAAETLLNVNSHFEKRSKNTRENAAFMAELFPHLIAGGQTLVFMAHLIHTRRVLMTKRQAFCHDFGFMTEAEFDARAHVVAYDTKIPALDPRDPVKLAETLARLKVYSEAGHIKASADEAETLRKIYTRATEYALRADNDEYRNTRIARANGRRARL